VTRQVNQNARSPAVRSGQDGLDADRLSHAEQDDLRAQVDPGSAELRAFDLRIFMRDNGAEFGASFHWHALDKGIQHVYIKPRTPRLNGKVERSHRIDAEEFYRLLDGVVIDDTNLFNDKLRDWEDFYNYHRPHGGLGGQTPYERLRQKTHTQV
jgi:transposase InsO family protein